MDWFIKERVICVQKGGPAPRSVFVTTIQPKGEHLRQAVRWISAERLEDESKAIPKLIQEAALRFNLSPMEEEYLVSFYRQRDEGV
jgi:hypothetical protein